MLAGEALERRFGHEGGALRKGVSAFIKETQRALSAPLPRAKVAVSETGSGLLLDTEPPSALTPTSQPSELSQINFCHR